MSEQWTLKGKIVANHLLPELNDAFGSTTGVAGITVKVSARSKIPLGWGTWNGWGKVTTGADGSFRVSENRGFAVQVPGHSTQPCASRGGAERE